MRFQSHFNNFLQAKAGDFLAGDKDLPEYLGSVFPKFLSIGRTSKLLHLAVFYVFLYFLKKIACDAFLGSLFCKKFSPVAHF